jgi:hypothetical protein
MAKEKDDVTPEVTGSGTTRPGFNQMTTTDAPDHDGNPNAATPSQRVQEEQAAGRAAVRDLGHTPAAISSNPADRDPAHAAEVATAINAEHEEHDLREANKTYLPEGESDPTEVPSRGLPYEILPGEELTQGTPDHKIADPRLQDPDTEVGKKAEGLRLSREAEEARVKETVDRANRGSGGNESADYKDKKAQHERDERNKKK